jgi:LPS export ABC transporter protein LptC
MVRKTQILLIVKSGSLLNVCLALFFFVFFLAGCKKIEQNQAVIIAKEEDPVMSASNIEVLFSDSGQLQARLVSPRLNRFEGESPYIEFPNGFTIFIFDSLQRVSSTITGNKGIRRDRARTMEAWGKIVVRNELKNEQLNTEHLIWDEAKRRIWSDVKVTIIRPDQVIYGTSMEANEAFTSYSITNMSGAMMVKQDSI